MKRKDIEAGVAGFAEKLGSAVSFFKLPFEVPDADSLQSRLLLQQINLPNRKGAETPLLEGAGDDNRSIVTATNNNAGTFVASIGGVRDNVG